MKGSVYLLLTSAIWGFALVAQKEGMSYLDAFSFTALRCLLGGLSLLPLVLWRNRQTGQSSDTDSKKNLNENADGISDVNRNQNADRSPDVNSACCKKTTWIAALQCGFFLTCLMLFQQLGLPYTTVGKAAFVTSLYIPITPLLERFSGKKISRRIWISIGKKEIQDMIDEGKEIEVNCQFCNKHYKFSVDELGDLLKKATRE